jgi:hypothetical protein
VRRKKIVLLAMLAILAAFVGWLAWRTRQPPLLPRDAVHADAGASERCLTCHGPDGVLPRSKNHPPGDDCFRCHGVSR